MVIIMLFRLLQHFVFTIIGIDNVPMQGIERNNR